MVRPKKIDRFPPCGCGAPSVDRWQGKYLCRDCMMDEPEPPTLEDFARWKPVDPDGPPAGRPEGWKHWRGGW